MADSSTQYRTSLGPAASGVCQPHLAPGRAFLKGACHESLKHPPRTVGSPGPLTWEHLARHYLRYHEPWSPPSRGITEDLGGPTFAGTGLIACMEWPRSVCGGRVQLPAPALPPNRGVAAARWNVLRFEITVSVRRAQSGTNGYSALVQREGGRSVSPTQIVCKRVRFPSATFETTSGCEQRRRCGQTTHYEDSRRNCADHAGWACMVLSALLLSENRARTGSIPVPAAKPKGSSRQLVARAGVGPARRCSLPFFNIHHPRAF